MVNYNLRPRPLVVNRSVEKLERRVGQNVRHDEPETPPVTRGTPLAGSRVLVTGGTLGIGRLMAAGAIERGAEVVLWARDAERGAQVAAELGPAASFTGVDVTDAGAVAAAEQGRRAPEPGPIRVRWGCTPARPR